MIKWIKKIINDINWNFERKESITLPYPPRKTDDPSVLWLPYLEECVGKQHKDWDWHLICPSDGSRTIEKFPNEWFVNITVTKGKAHLLPMIALRLS